MAAEKKKRRPYRKRPPGPNGGLIWTGASLLNNEEIMVAVTGRKTGSQNPKIGRMAQIWILPLRIEPLDAIPNGFDESVCGSCKHRPSTGGKCYVSARWGPQQVWHTHNVFRSYEQLGPEMFKGIQVRFGAWGDPAAVPMEVWQPILDACAGWTGYTHQWEDLDVDVWGWLMASVDTPKEHAEAKRRGWRTFRVRQRNERLLAGEIDCPAPSKKSTCETCMLCNGVRPKVKDIAIEIHGSRVRTKRSKAEAAKVRKVQRPKRNGIMLHVSLRTVEKAKRLLKQMPRTDAEMAEALGISERNTREMMKALRAGNEIVAAGARGRVTTWGLPQVGRAW